ncbi:O-antigen ligase family protein [Solwaraspora sp. WMMD1047]|uniref:O-antigen ligase family protein n=1 Tax=Solwaraspora sp. WMMD1047 TaxID=3016102 RepID=UPI002417374F|nr:O-antigen ligase family protein [Solwaraspora sp. WMMD1047]MDG4828829.1 O-antigen ligase family protein [Solwaraspora sp. WMMD1047]
MTSPALSFPVGSAPGRVHPAPVQRPGRDATVGLALAVLLAYLLPHRLIFPPLTILGRPAVLVGFGLLVWWTLTRLHPTLARRGPQPMRWVLTGYLATVAASYAAGHARGLSALESAGADRTVLMALAAGGVLLAAADGLGSRDRIDTVLRVFCWGSTAMALIGLSQFSLRINLTNHLQLPPLLTFQRDQIGFSIRGTGDLVRVASTTGHYIEFSLLMVIGLLVAIHFARFSDHRRDRQIYLTLAIIQAGVIPISLSRTGVLALAAGLLLLVLVWPLRTTFNVLIVGAALAALIQVLRPGLLATLRALLLAGDRDPSVAGRLEDYDYAAPFVRDSPLLGRGVGTWLPELYQMLDNQWLATLITGGLVGVAGLAFLLLAGALVAARARRRLADPRGRDLAAVLAVAIVVLGIGALAFDALYYSTYLITLHLLLGLAGALWRVTRADRINDDSGTA